METEHASHEGGDVLDRARVSDYTVRRLSMYYRILDELERESDDVVSSASLARMTGTNSAQVRKDLSYFGNFGKRGRGYSVSDLRVRLRAILGLDRQWKVLLVGAGHLGSALLSYKDFAKRGFHIVGILDNDPEKLGQSWDGITVNAISEAEEVVARTGAEVAVIVTPAHAAQEVIERLARAGVRGFLNFAPFKPETTEPVRVRNVNITIELEGLAYALQHDELTRPSL